MKKKQDGKKGEPKQVKDIEEIAKLAEKGEDVSEYFTGEFSTKQRVNVDFPINLLKLIDSECKRIGVTRQAWIKMACDERIRQIKSSSIAA